MLYATGLALHREDPDHALEYFEEAAALVREGAVFMSIGINLAQLARLRDERGELSAAFAALDEGLEYFRRIGPQLDLPAIVAQLCRTFARNDRPEAAAVLAGVLSEGAIADLAGARTPERVARATAPARNQLGDTTYEQLFARGAAMSYADAMTYARTQLKELPNTPQS
jgi:hypothetical protein